MSLMKTLDQSVKTLDRECNLERAKMRWNWRTSFPEHFGEFVGSQIDKNIFVTLDWSVETFTRERNLF